MSSDAQVLRHLGRYAMFGEIAAGGMATVHLGRLLGPVGFARTVVIKRMRRELTRHEEFATMFIDEACLAACVKHPNVVATLDVVSHDDELFIVMDYVHGESLDALLAASAAPMPPAVAVAVAVHALLGLHAAHEATSADGAALEIVHRDFSPHNVLVDVDGIARVVDFGMAKARQKQHRTRDGQVKGKWAYMSPEQVAGEAVDRRSDVFAAGILLWEVLTGERLFAHDNPAKIAAEISFREVAAPSASNAACPAALDAVVLKALAKDPDERFQTARAMAEALRRALAPADTLEVASWLEATAGAVLAERAAAVSAMERASASLAAIPRAAVVSHVESARPALPTETRAFGTRVDTPPEVPPTHRTPRPAPIEDEPAAAPEDRPSGREAADLARKLAASTVLADSAPEPIASVRESARQPRAGEGAGEERARGRASLRAQPSRHARKQSSAPDIVEDAPPAPRRPTRLIGVLLIAAFAIAAIVLFAVGRDARAPQRPASSARP